MVCWCRWSIGSFSDPVSRRVVAAHDECWTILTRNRSTTQIRRRGPHHLRVVSTRRALRRRKSVGLFIIVEFFTHPWSYRVLRRPVCASGSPEQILPIRSTRVRQGCALVYLALGISKSVTLKSRVPYEWRDTHIGPSGVVRVEVCLRGSVGDCEVASATASVERSVRTRVKSRRSERLEAGAIVLLCRVRIVWCIDLSRILSSLKTVLDQSALL
jgi:hypothetical protein